MDLLLGRDSETPGRGCEIRRNRRDWQLSQESVVRVFP